MRDHDDGGVCDEEALKISNSSLNELNRAKLTNLNSASQPGDYIHADPLEEPRDRVHVHRGTREAPQRLAHLRGAAPTLLRPGPPAHLHRRRVRLHGVQDTPPAPHPSPPLHPAVPPPPLPSHVAAASRSHSDTLTVPLNDSRHSGAIPAAASSVGALNTVVPPTAVVTRGDPPAHLHLVRRRRRGHGPRTPSRYLPRNLRRFHAHGNEWKKFTVW